MFGDHLSDFHRPGIEAAGVDDEWSDPFPVAPARFTPPADLRCRAHRRNFCALCDGEGAS